MPNIKNKETEENIKGKEEITMETPIKLIKSYEIYDGCKCVTLEFNNKGCLVIGTYTADIGESDEFIYGDWPEIQFIGECDFNDPKNARTILAIMDHMGKAGVPALKMLLLNIAAYRTYKDFIKGMSVDMTDEPCPPMIVIYLDEKTINEVKSRLGSTEIKVELVDW